MDVQLFGTTLQETFDAFNPRKYDSDRFSHGSRKYRNKKKAIIRIVVTVIIFAACLFFYYIEIPETANTILGAILGYWLK